MNDQKPPFRMNGAEALCLQDAARIIELQVNRLMAAGIPPLSIVDILCECVACVTAQSELALQKDFIVRTIQANLPGVIDKHVRRVAMLPIVNPMGGG